MGWLPLSGGLQGLQYEMHWVIEMPSENRNTREVFVTVHALSLERAEVINGCATIVWAVVKLEDMKDRETKNQVNDNCVFEWSIFSNPSQIYVLKQYWRPTAGQRENELFLEDNHSLYSSEDVKMGSGQPVDTQNFIQQDILYVEPTSPSADEQAQELTSSTLILIGQMDLSTLSTTLMDDSEDEQVAANRQKWKQGLDRFHIYENAEPFAFLGLAQLFQALAEPIKHAPTYWMQYHILLKNMDGRSNM